MSKQLPMLSFIIIILILGFYMLWPEQIAKGYRLETMSENRIAVEPDTTPPKDQSSALHQTIEHYIQSLAKLEEFQSWKGAKWTKYPLGPGIRGWIIILEQAQKEVGYLVVYPEEDHGFVLGEYGTGTYPLFSMNTLYHSLIRQELIPNHTSYSDFANDMNMQVSRIYFDSLYSFWLLDLNGQTYYFDAKTGEQWFMTDDLATILMRYATNSDIGSFIANPAVNGPRHSLHAAVFDPFDDLSWLVKPPLESEQFEQVKQAIQDGIQLVYAARLLDKQLLKPYAVIGVHEWDDAEPYLIVEEDGPRYIPFSTTLKHGHLYYY